MLRNGIWLLYLAIFSLIGLSPGYAQTVPAGEIIEKARTNIVEVWQRMPDFVCAETITYRVFEKGKMKSETVVETEFSSTGNLIESIHESRKVIRIDGRPVKEGTAMPLIPLLSGDVTILSQASLLISPFFSTFSDAVSGSIGNHPTFKIEATGLIAGFNVKTSGSVWIDKESMQVMRTEYRYAETPAMFEWKAYERSADYAAVEFDGKPFWLPTTLKVERARDPNKKDGPAESLDVQYRNCHKFGASVDLQFGETAVSSPRP